MFLLIRYEKLDPTAVWSTLTNVEISLWLICLGITFTLAKAFRIRVLLRSGGFDVTYIYCVQLIFKSYYFDMYGLGQVGGLFSRFFYLNQLSREKKVLITTILLGEIAIGTYTIFLFAGLSLWQLTLLQSVPDFTKRLLFICAIAVLIGPLIPTLLKRSTFFSTIKSVTSAKVLITAVLASFVEFTIKAMALFIVARHMVPDQSISYFTVSTMFSLGALVSVLPIGLAGAGPGHLGYQFFWENMSGSSSTFGADLYTMFWFQHLMLAGIGMLIVLFQRGQSTPNK